ncbi:MAG: FAD-dependent oxidoreductase [Candidatus Pacearchaeota archaeon]
MVKMAKMVKTEKEAERGSLVDQVYDIAIVGGGIAGLTAAIYARRKELKVVIIASDIGGQLNAAGTIENYPGFEKIKGSELIKNIYNKVISLGPDFILDEVVGIEKIKDIFGLKLASGSGDKVKARAIILAFGKSPRKLGIGEEPFIGKGVSTCIICDAPLYKNKVVAVVGGGNSAIDAALELSQIAKKVYLIHRRELFRADEASLKKLKQKANVEFLLNSEITKIEGKNVVESIAVRDVKSNKESKLSVDGLFLELGFEMKSEWLRGFVKLDALGQIVIDNLCQTSQKGVFAAGDCTNVPFKQAIISAGQGAIAALQAYQYLTGGKGARVEWN